MYLTRNALTLGIKKVEIDYVLKKDNTADYHSTYKNGDTVSLSSKNGVFYYGYYTIGKNVFIELDEAVKQANSMKEKKIKSLEKQLEKVKSMRFV